MSAILNLEMVLGQCLGSCARSGGEGEAVWNLDLARPLL